MTFWEADILGVDILGVVILSVDFLGVDILGRTPREYQSGGANLGQSDVFSFSPKLNNTFSA